MKVSLVYPPQWTPLNPHFSIASLAAQLRANSYDVDVYDLNIEFFNSILKKTHLQNSLAFAFDMIEPLFHEVAKEFQPGKPVDKYSVEFQSKLIRYTKIKEAKTTKKAEYLDVIDDIESALSSIKSKDDFYNPIKLLESLGTIDKALEIASLPYTPSIIQFHNYYNQFFKLTYESIKNHCQDRSTNMFYDFYERKIPDILKKETELIGISINSSTQIIPGLTLAMLLKQASSIPICIGGNYFGRITQELSEQSEFFELFADYVLVEEGEKPIVELCRFIEGKIGKQQIPNVLYLENSKVITNPKTCPLSLNQTVVQDLEGFPLDLYMTSDIVLSEMTSRGCYWKKCSFCDQDFGQHHNIKDAQKLVSELKHLNQKFRISHFEFIDESIHPDYLKEMSEMIIDAGLKINWFMNARLETAFSEELLKLAHKAGLRMILWGFESGSDRIMKLINKGIDINKRFEVLQNSKNAGIWNFAFIFFGFPSETKEEAQMTIDIIKNNTDLISSYGRSIFTLGKHSKLRDDPGKYHITNIYKTEEEFSPSYIFETSSGMSQKEIIEMAHKCTQECNEAYDKPLWMHLRDREVLMLYISEFGADVIQNTKIES